MTLEEGENQSLSTMHMHITIPKSCKPFLERILGIRISHIEYPKSQEIIDLSADAKSVRLDIYVEDGKGTVYNIEMQTTENRNLPRRARYYQEMIKYQRYAG